MSAPPGKKPIAVIGAGFSGTITTLQLLRRLPRDQPILLCERAAEFARGVAYAGREHEHLLNVRAANMSAFPDEPGHFTDWLARRADHTPDRRLAGLHQTEVGAFASRSLYGQYLRALLDEALRQTAGYAQLRLLPDEITGIAPSRAPGSLGGYTLHCADGQALDVAGAVLAVGNLPAEEDSEPHLCRNAWGQKAWQPLAEGRQILIVGTGLTMVDLAIGLRNRGFGGPIVAVSRGGFLPLRHAPATPWPTPALTAAETASLPLLLRRLRRDLASAARQGVDWRAVIDSVRPITTQLWSGLPDAERRRFLRHVRRYWDVHRHRMAPPHADQIAAMQQDGSLRVLAGRIRAMTPLPDGMRVTFQPRASSATCDMDVQRVIIASGTPSLSHTHDPLMLRLIEAGLVRADAQGMGLDVDADLHTIGKDGVPVGNLWALGPIVRGVFWECVAVPDIRVQAAQLAESVVTWCRLEEAHWGFAI